MKYFYFGTLPIFDVTAKINRVDIADTPLNEMVYVTNIKTKNYFVLKSYDFSVLLCHATSYEHLDDINKLRRTHGMLDTHILVTHMEDRAEVLYQVAADTDLGVTVHFLKREDELETHLVNLIRCLEE